MGWQFFLETLLFNIDEIFSFIFFENLFFFFRTHTRSLLVIPLLLVFLCFEVRRRFVHFFIFVLLSCFFFCQKITLIHHTQFFCNTKLFGFVFCRLTIVVFNTWYLINGAFYARAYRVLLLISFFDIYFNKKINVKFRNETLENVRQSPMSHTLICQRLYISYMAAVADVLFSKQQLGCDYWCVVLSKDFASKANWYR